ncbi:lipopolysaccharide biosynthesis protein [Jannaschia aquimarina]|uniref:Polysaccharide biosynthesis protein n=1 Tax=Jannaschia aquimarina TaxID=935700 RepID=A0A0D1EIU3_9RHOB|nr:oligosaccharide flippase family protein [Jannaschia aquimarina]KIT17554.1 Polysaccharide biosynthesis protein [Jannaschia aquimarina]SNS73002.1 Membrane protein involved in the export of O-antigen and teichoic acid [Jannaschia aquimarina]
MRAPASAYLAGAVGVAGGTVASSVAGFASLLLLTQILSKEMFGGYAFAMAVVTLVSVLATLGLDRALMLRVAGIEPSSRWLRGGGLALRVTLICTAVAGALGALMAVTAEPFVSMGLMPEARFWLPALALSAVPFTAGMVLHSWYQANHRVAFAAAMPGIGDLSRCLFFAVVLLAGFGASGVAAAAVLGATVPVALLIWQARGRTRRAPRRLNGGDFTKGIQFVTIRLAQESGRQVDLVMMGLLATGAATADYAIAARIAAIADQGRQSLKPTFMPRTRRWIAAGDTAAALREFARTRDAGFAAALAAATLFTLSGMPILSLFGAFEQAYSVLLLVTLGFVLNTGLGLHAAYLAMHGEVGWSALLRVGGLVLLVALNFLLIPRFGAVGAATAAALTQGVINVASATLAWRLTGLIPVDRMQVVLIVAAVIALTAGATAALSPVAAGGLLGAAFLIAAFRSRSVLRELARMALARRARKP